MTENTSGDGLTEADSLAASEAVPTAYAPSVVSTNKPRISRLTSIVVCLVIVALAGSLIWVLVERQQLSNRRAAGRGALLVAERSIPRIFSYDSKSIKGAEAASLQLLAPPFKAKYRQLMTTKVVPAVIQGQITAVAKVVVGGVSSSSETRVRVLLFVDVTTTAPSLKKPVTAGSRLVVTLVKQSGQWLVSGVSPV